MKLDKLLERLDYTVVQGSDSTEVTTLINDSRKVEEGSVFVCISGAVSDGHKYAADVAAKGAAAVVVEKDVEVPENVTVIKVEDTRYALALMSAAYFGYPADKMKVIGITGTKGKTTTTYMIKSILEETGHKVGLIGTIEAIIGDKKIPSCNTTPESYTIHKYFAEMVEAGCDCVVMEVSSQGQREFHLRSVFSQILEEIILVRMSIRILMITRDVKVFCSSSVSSESPMWMTSISKMYLKGLHVRLRHSDFHRRQIFAQRM